jgi:hypothetical protein
MESCSSVPVVWKCPTHVPTDGQAARLSVQATAFPFTVPTSGREAGVSVDARPQGKPGVKVPVMVPAVESTVRSTTDPSWLRHVERPEGIGWMASVTVADGVGAVGVVGIVGPVGIVGVVGVVGVLGVVGVAAGGVVLGCVGVLGVVGDCAAVSPAVAITATAVTRRSARLIQ